MILSQRLCLSLYELEELRNEATLCKRVRHQPAVVPALTELDEEPPCAPMQAGAPAALCRKGHIVNFVIPCSGGSVRAEVFIDPL